MHFTQQSVSKFPLFTVFHSVLQKKTTKRQVSQGRTSPFEAECIFIAAQKSKWERKANNEVYMNVFIVFDFWNVKYGHFGIFTRIIWVYCITIIYKVASVWICSSKHLVLIKITINKTYNSSQPYSYNSLSKKKKIRDFWRWFWWNERPSPTLTQFKISAWGLKAENNLCLGVVQLWNILQHRGQAAVVNYKWKPPQKRHNTFF